MTYDPYALKFTSKESDIPKGHHYAILEFGSVYIPGDERSRTNPGHGYPEHSETTLSYQWTEDREKWVAEIQHREKQIGYGRKPYVALEVVGQPTVNVVVGVQ